MKIDVLNPKKATGDNWKIGGAIEIFTVACLSKNCDMEKLILKMFKKSPFRLADYKNPKQLFDEGIILSNYLNKYFKDKIKTVEWCGRDVAHIDCGGDIRLTLDDDSTVALEMKRCKNGKGTGANLTSKDILKIFKDILTPCQYYIKNGWSSILKRLAKKHDIKFKYMEEDKVTTSFVRKDFSVSKDLKDTPFYNELIEEERAFRIDYLKSLIEKEIDKEGLKNLLKDKIIKADKVDYLVVNNYNKKGECDVLMNRVKFDETAEYGIDFKNEKSFTITKNNEPYVKINVAWKNGTGLNNFALYGFLLEN